MCAAANSTRSSGYFSNFVLYASISNERGGVVTAGMAGMAVAVTAASAGTMGITGITEAVSIILRIVVVETNDINR